jgi:hypothetical protein
MKIQSSGRRLGIAAEIVAEHHHETRVTEMLPAVPEALCQVNKARSRLRQYNFNGKTLLYFKLNF